MPVYSETIAADYIFEKLPHKTNNILIVGCGACMNESLAYKYNTPIFIKNDLNRIIPISIINELERVKLLLAQQGYKSEYEVLPEDSNSRCMINLNQKQYKPNNKMCPDVVLALCCNAGVYGLKKLFKDIPIIKITIQRGVLAYGYKDNSLGQRIIEQEHSIVL